MMMMMMMFVSITQNPHMLFMVYVCTH